MPYFLLTLALIAADQFVKYLVLTYIPLHGSVPFIPYIMDLTYIQNTGAAFSLFSEHTWVLTLCSLAMSIILAIGVWKKFFSHPLGRIPLTMLLAGAIGNLIDRAFRGFVVDMFRTLFIHFAVFNVADICVVVGGIAAGLYYVFLYDKLEGKKGEDLIHDQADQNG